MPTELEPTGIAPTAANYAHAVEIPARSRLVHTSGILPIRPDGTVPDDDGEQAEVVWANIAAILRAADLEPSDLVSVTTYCVPGVDLGAVMAARDRALGGHRCASILLTVHALAQPAWRLEIAVVAAAAGGESA